MKVWLLEYHIPYQPGWIDGVFSSEKAAQDAVKTTHEWKREHDGTLAEVTPDLHEFHTVTEYVMDAPPSECVTGV